MPKRVTPHEPKRQEHGYATDFEWTARHGDALAGRSPHLKRATSQACYCCPVCTTGRVPLGAALQVAHALAERGSTQVKPSQPCGMLRSMRLMDCDRGRHGDAILLILNEVIANSTALYDYKPRNSAAMDAWFARKLEGGFPVIGAFDEQDGLLGFASYGTFRAWPAYKYSVEHSVYVAAAARGRGVGRALLAALIERAREQNYHALIGGIDAANAVSIQLHRSLGFQHVGTLSQVGFKFGRWLDLAFYQLLLETPFAPADG